MTTTAIELQARLRDGEYLTSIETLIAGLYKQYPATAKLATDELNEMRQQIADLQAENTLLKQAMNAAV